MAPSMATTSRLTFLYPHLCAGAGRLGEPTARQFQSARRSNAGAARNDRSTRNQQSPPPPPPPVSTAPSATAGASSFGTVSTPRRSAFAKRHGTAVEPLPIHNLPKKGPPSQAPQAQPRRQGQANDPKTQPPQSKDDRAASKSGQSRAVLGSVLGGGGVKDADAQKDPVRTNDSPANEHAATRPPSEETAPGQLDGKTSQRTGTAHQEAEPPSPDLDPSSPALAKDGTNGPMDIILEMNPSTSSSGSSELNPPEATANNNEDESPAAAAAATATDSPNPQNGTTSVAIVSAPNSTPTTHSVLADRPPHLAPPPYVHHFDTYSFVKQLTAAGWTMGQAIVAMKAIRTCLARNLAVAQSGLVSKSDVENETYLFRAACSELGAEMHNNRRVADEQLRQQRTHLQHEVDILAQRLNQELQTLNDNVRGMFNARRMAVREEQKTVESAIQQINYKISVMLNSDARYEVEGLRWVLIRRSVLGIIFMAVITLGSLRYATFRSHERQKEELEQKRREADEATTRRKRQQDAVGKIDTAAAPEAAVLLTAT